jgi:hypothetical protein
VLATADQITVEGDDKLFYYAVNKAAGDPEHHVAVEVTGPWPVPTLTQSRPLHRSELL